MDQLEQGHLDDPLDDPLDDHLDKHDVHIEEETAVCWNDDSKQHPLNWGAFSKYYTVAVVIWLGFYMTILSSSGVCRLCLWRDAADRSRL